MLRPSFLVKALFLTVLFFSNSFAQTATTSTELAKGGVQTDLAIPIGRSTTHVAEQTIKKSNLRDDEDY